MATEITILPILKADLQLTTTANDAYLSQLIDSSKKDIALVGITLDLTDIEDALTVSIYAAYLYRNRADQNNGMPRMLQYRLNQRLLHEKMKDTTTSTTGSDSSAA